MPDSATTKLKAAWAGSTVGRSIDRVLLGAGFGAMLAVWIRGSYLYQWATESPATRMVLATRSALLQRVLPRSALQNSSLVSIANSNAIVTAVLAAAILTLPLGRYNLSIFELPDVLLLVAAALLGLRTLAADRLSLSRPAMVSMVLVTALLIWQALSVAVRGSPDGMLVKPFEHWAWFVAIMLYVRRRADAERVLSIVSIMAVGVAVTTLLAAIVHLPTEPRTIPPRAFGPFMMPVGRVRPVVIFFGVMGMLLLFPLPWLLLRAWRRRSWAAVGGAGAIILAVVVTQSRSTYLALVAAMGVLGVAAVAWAVLRGPEAIRDRVAGAAVLGIVGGVPAAVVGGQLLIGANPLTFLYRLQQYRTALLVMVQRPLFGTGLGQFQAVTGLSEPVHAAWLELGAETGMLGLGLFAAVAYLAGREMTRVAATDQDWFAAAVLAGAAAIAVEASFQAGFGRLTWVALALGLTLSSVNHD